MPNRTDSSQRRDTSHRPARPRDPFIDVLRVIAIIMVVAQHWLMPALSYENGVLHTGNAFTTPGAWTVTWLSQVMPLVFFAGGAAAEYSLRSKRKGHRGWLGTRLQRLAVPVVPLVIMWLPLPHLLLTMGLPAGPVDTASRLAGRLLWFLALYVLVTALAPALRRLHEKYRGVEVIGLAAGAVVVDIFRFAVLDGADVLGYANVFFIWVAVYQLGIVYASGGLRWMRGWSALATAGVGLTATALMVAFGPYPGSMIGMPGEPISNMNPPTLVLLSITALQVGLAMALRPVIDRWAGFPPVARGLNWLSARLMTIYVWHMPAMITVAGVSVVGFGWSTPPLLSAEWRSAMPIWVMCLVALLAVFLRLFSRFEQNVPPVTGRRPWRTGVATVLVGLGLLSLAVNGFAPDMIMMPYGPVGTSLAIFTGIALLLPSQAERRTARASAQPAHRAPGDQHAPAAAGHDGASAPSRPADMGLAPPSGIRVPGSQRTPEREKVEV